MPWPSSPPIHRHITLVKQQDPSSPLIDLRLSSVALDFLRRLLDGAGTYRYVDHPTITTTTISDCVRQIRDKLVEQLSQLDPIRNDEQWRSYVKQVFHSEHGLGYTIDHDRLKIITQNWPPEKDTILPNIWDEPRLLQRKEFLKHCTMPVKAKFVSDWTNDTFTALEGLVNTNSQSMVVT